jgi:hypothetical protein
MAGVAEMHAAQKVVCELTGDKFGVELMELKPKTRYYVRSYVHNIFVWGYGE